MPKKKKKGKKKGKKKVAPEPPPYFKVTLPENYGNFCTDKIAGGGGAGRLLIKVMHKKTPIELVEFGPEKSKQKPLQAK